MPQDDDRTIAVLYQAIAVCRGMLYSARTGDATQGEIERILEGTGQESLTALLGQETLRRVWQLSEALPPEDRDVLLAIWYEPY
jgi:DNA-directed RNA polymerase specialized sigma24 family protein